MRIRDLLLFLLVSTCIIAPIRCDETVDTAEPHPAGELDNNGVEPQPTELESQPTEAIEENVEDPQPIGEMDASGPYPGGYASDNSENIRTGVNAGVDLAKVVIDRKFPGPQYPPYPQPDVQLPPSMSGSVEPSKLPTMRSTSKPTKRTKPRTTPRPTSRPRPKPGHRRPRKVCCMRRPCKINYEYCGP